MRLVRPLGFIGGEWMLSFPVRDQRWKGDSIAWPHSLLHLQAQRPSGRELQWYQGMPLCSFVPLLGGKGMGKGKQRLESVEPQPLLGAPTACSGQELADMGEGEQVGGDLQFLISGEFLS